MSKTLFMMKGLPASGKSTSAQKMLEDFGVGNAIRVNNDSLRLMLDGVRFTESRNAGTFMESARDMLVTMGLSQNRHVIVDDTNLHPKHEQKLRGMAKVHNAAFEVVDFTGVSVDECISRDLRRVTSVGSDVILRMYRQFLEKRETPIDDLPWKCVICDIDGTVAQMNGRSPYEWDKVEMDTPRGVVLSAVNKLTCTGFPTLIFMSGRDESCREQTERWLGQHVSHPFTLHMRPAGDMRRDSIVKEELYNTHIKGKYKVIAIFDDRPQVIRLWQRLGFTDRIFNVGDGREF